MQTLDERKLVIGQLKSVEKLLEEVIAEKDSLTTSNTKHKHEVQKVMQKQCRFYFLLRRLYVYRIKQVPCSHS